MTVWKFIAEKMEAGTDVVLLYVLESQGSSPGRQGFKMAVAGDGSFAGSIGGGIMEHKFVEMAKAELHRKHEPMKVHRQVHDKSAGSQHSGMICSGEQTIFIYKLQPTDLPQVKNLLRSMRSRENGSLHLNRAGILFTTDVPESNFTFRMLSEQEFILIEKTGYKNRLHIIGGGHCALAFSRLMRNMDFYITVYDNRKNLSTMQLNHYAHEQVIVEHYSGLEQLIQGGENVYVVIMTFGYRTDDEALRSLYKKPFRYIGLMGSAKKIETLFEQYRSQDMDPVWLKQVHSPIGLQIKSQTPEEIAVSIAAEIIAVKNQ